MRFPSISDISLHNEINIFLRGEIASFEALCEGLTKVCRRSNTFRLADYEQESIYQRLLKLKEDVLKTEAIPAAWVTRSTVQQWMTVLAYCKDLPKREIFLNLEVKLIEQMGSLQDIETIACHTLHHLPEIFNTKDISRLLYSLWPYLARIKQDNKIIVGNDIFRALQGLKHCSQEAKILQNIFDELAWHIEQNAKIGNWFNSSQLAYGFLSLQNISDTAVAKSLLSALLKHLQHLTHTQQPMDGQEIELLMCGIRNMPDHELIYAILQSMTFYIQQANAQSNWIDHLSLTSMLGSLRNMHANETVDQFLQAIQQQFAHYHSVGQVSTTIKFSTVLPGLRHLSHLPVAIELLDSFASRFSLPGRISPPSALHLQCWLAEAIYFLTEYFEHPEGRQTAMNLITKALEIFSPIVSLPLNTTSLLTAEGREKTIMHLGGFVIEETQQIGLSEYPCSFEFAQFLAITLKNKTDIRYTGWSLVVDDNYTTYEQERLRTLFSDYLGVIKLYLLEGKEKHSGIVTMISKEPASKAQDIDVDLPSPSARHKRTNDEMNSSSEDTIGEPLDSSASLIAEDESIGSPLAKKAKILEEEVDAFSAHPH